jgi:glutamate/tyrosine decarboxylase-like PLP-dependent enzyme
LFGLGSNSIRWIATENNRMDIQLLEKTILEDLNNNNLPMMVVGNAGDVSTGATDDLEAIALICRRFGIWFHVDGAYGLPAAIIPEMKPLFKGIEEADSIAMDPHKWLYSPLEAGCTLIRDMDLLKQTFSFHPVYYNFSGDDEYQPLNYYEYGLQNSRGFRALKVWLAIQQAGRKGYEKMIAEDIRLSKLLYKLVGENHELEAVTQNLSITTLRYVPEANNDLTYLNELNEALANDLQTGGEAFLSNAIIDGKYCLRACIVNFRTSEEDVVSLIDIIINQGRKIHKKLREKTIIQV